MEVTVSWKQLLRCVLIVILANFRRHTREWVEFRTIYNLLTFPSLVRNCDDLLYKSLCCCSSSCIESENTWCSPWCLATREPNWHLWWVLGIGWLYSLSPDTKSCAFEWCISLFLYFSFLFFFFLFCKLCRKRNKQAETKNLMDIFFTGSFINSIWKIPKDRSS